MKDFTIRIANEKDFQIAEIICEEYSISAKIRGTGIAKRNPIYIIDKMKEGKAIIAYHKSGDWVGFCYIETFSSNEYVSNSGLIVKDKYRNEGLASSIKKRIFKLSRTKYPDAKIFGITTSGYVMKINNDLGYKPVIFSDLTKDDEFWKGCQSCPNYEILTRKERKMCLCTGMLYVHESKWCKIKKYLKSLIRKIFK